MVKTVDPLARLRVRTMRSGDGSSYSRRHARADVQLVAALGGLLTLR
ncbi:hypothetical protein [Amycolatopsis sp. NPDC051716]